MSDRSVCSVCWCAYAYQSIDCNCECHKRSSEMGVYIKPSTDKTYVWLVWMFKNFEVEGRREIHSVHSTKQGAVYIEELLPKDELYYSIEKVELRT